MNLSEQVLQHQNEAGTSKKPRRVVDVDEIRSRGEKFPTGIYIDGNYSTADEFSLEIIEFAEEQGMRLKKDDEKYLEDHDETTDENYGQIVHDMSEDAVEWLNDNVETPPYTYWTIEESSLFLLPNVEEAREDVEFITPDEAWRMSGKNVDSHPPKNFRGLWLFVSDHGNVTLYERTRKGMDVEKWSVV